MQHSDTEKAGNKVVMDDLILRVVSMMSVKDLSLLPKVLGLAFVVLYQFA